MLMNIRSIFLLAAMGCLPVLAHADEPATVPASMPSATTAPAEIPADQASPLGAVKMLFIANAKGDGTAIKNLVATQNDAEKSFVNAIGEQKNADRLLTDLLHKKFPAESDDVDGKRAAIVSMISTMVDAGSQDIHGDQAEISVAALKSMKKPWVVKKVDGLWKVDFGSFTNDLNADTMQKVQAQVEAITAVMSEGADDVSSGKYPRLQDAMKGIASKMTPLMTPSPTTAPATQP